MAQSLCPGVPAFCLYGNRNKFAADSILKQWKYIFLSLDSLMSDVPIPSSWLTWFTIKKPTRVKPSIILPLGKFVAGVHHLRIIYTTCVVTLTEMLAAVDSGRKAVSGSLLQTLQPSTLDKRDLKLYTTRKYTHQNNK